MIDGVCDYLAFFAVLIPVALSFSNYEVMFSFCLAAGVAHAVQSTWLEAEREVWKRRARGHFTQELRPASGQWMDAVYNAAELHLGNRVRAVDTTLAERPALIPDYLAATAPLVRGLSPLTANGRTLALPVACLLRHAEYYWVWELIGLSAFAVLMARALRSAEARIVAASQRMRPSPFTLTKQ